MTSHELANLLLSMPEDEVGFLQYDGCNDEFVSVESVVKYDPKYGYGGLLLRSFKET